MARLQRLLNVDVRLGRGPFLAEQRRRPTNVHTAVELSAINARLVQEGLSIEQAKCVTFYSNFEEETYVV